MISTRFRTATWTTVALLTIALAGCVTISPPPADPAVSGSADSGPVDEVVPDGPKPAWYGEDFDARGCPIPRDGAPLAAFDDAESLLGVPLPSGWCIYKSVTYTTFYVIPSTIDAGFDADVRALLEPAGWSFDPADDGSPDWSWITSYPQSALDLGFTDPEIDGSIFITTSLTEEQASNSVWWYGELIKTFDDFELGGYVGILGFW